MANASLDSRFSGDDFASVAAPHVRNPNVYKGFEQTVRNRTFLRNFFNHDTGVDSQKSCAFGYS
ncbi:hypothetical protein CS8_091260 [Cupriavidus sp. 8B]